MPDESEVVQADVFVEFPLTNGQTLRGHPVPFPVGRKIMAQFAAFDKTNDYERDLVPALDEFTRVSGITDAQILAADPHMQLGDICIAIQRFFFRRRQTSANGAATRSTPTTASPAPGA